MYVRPSVTAQTSSIMNIKQLYAVVPIVRRGGNGCINQLVGFGLLPILIMNVRKAVPTQRHDASVHRKEAGFALRQRLRVDALVAQDVGLISLTFGLRAQ